MDNIACNPEFEEANKQLDEARANLIDALMQFDELMYRECKEIGADYVTKIGCYELKLYEFQIALLRVRRKIALVITKINHNQKPNEEDIEEELDIEYCLYEEQLRAQEMVLEAAIAYKSTQSLMTAEENDEIRRIYRTIMQRLHPDLHPNLTRSEMFLFQSALVSYDAGDITILHAIEIASLRPEPEKETPLLSEAERLGKIFDRIVLAETQYEMTQNNIAALKRSFPYSEKEFLADEQRVARRVAGLVHLIDLCKNEYALYERKLETLLGD